MNKNLRSFFFFILLTACCSVSFAQERKSKPKYSMDSLTIISPDVEIYNRVEMRKSEPDLKLREKVQLLIIDEAKKLLPKSIFIDLPIMNQDYRTVNHIVERNYGWMMRSTAQFDVPEELIVKNSKYTMLLTAGGSYGYNNRSIFRISIINNETKKFEYYEDLFIENISIKNLGNVKRQITHLIKKIIKN
jgi:hypothetical protein